MSFLNELARQMFEARDSKIAKLESENAALLARVERLESAIAGFLITENSIERYCKNIRDENHWLDATEKLSAAIASEHDK